MVARAGDAPPLSRARQAGVAAITHSPQVGAPCDREAPRDPRRGLRAAGPSASASYSDTELIPDEELGVIDRWTLIVHRLWRLAFKWRCLGHLGQWLNKVKQRGRQQ